MTTRPAALLLLFVLLVGSSGCSTFGWDPMRMRARSARSWSGRWSAAALTSHAPEARIVTPRAVPLLHGASDRPCEVLALVDEHARSDEGDEVLDRMRLEATRLGADAVIHVRFESSADGEGEVIHVTGTAVRYRDVVDGRAYEIVERIEVTDPRGREDHALERLRARAHRVHADLVLGVTFHHDAATDTVAVTGTAVRFTP